MKTLILTFLNSFKLLKTRAFRADKLFPLTHLSSITPSLRTALGLSLMRTNGLSARLRISHNFLVFLTKLYKHHGAEFTIKWLKASHVALQKYLAGDPLNSLRELEPKLPLPRLINGCPSVINKRDRSLMRSGNSNIMRYWMTLFSIYRVLKGPIFPKLSTITSPYSGSPSFLLDLITHQSIYFDRVKGFPFSMKAPTTLVLSHKSSPSNRLAYFGLVTDWFLIKYGNNPITDPGAPTPVYNNIMNYLGVLKKGGFPIARILSLFSSLDSLIDIIRTNKLGLPMKSTMVGSGLSQFAFKEEAAGKLRIFAILDSISQSVLRPLHDFLFDILKSIPNDGTFDQDSSVKRSAEKLQKYGIAYSFDLSAATDRLPVKLTASILEKLTKLEGFGQAWSLLMTDREFYISPSQIKKYFGNSLEGQDAFRYAVGQPMGGLSSWAGLAITHHWLLQYCSSLLSDKKGWDTRYEILGDDIVIFDHALALKYLEVMTDLGVEINQSKSLSSSTSVFEFAKRTYLNLVDISAVSLQQILSAVSIGTRVANAYSFTRRGLVKDVPHLGQLLSGSNSPTSFRNLKEVGLPAMSFLNLLSSQKIIELSEVLEVLVNPHIEDFDFEKSKFDLPLHSLLKHSLEALTLGIHPMDKFSKPELRSEIVEELLPHLSAVVLQEALMKIRTLNRDYEHLVKSGALSLYKGKGSSLIEAQFTGFFMDLIFDLSDLDISDKADEVEEILTSHAKYQHIPVEKALETLSMVESLIYKFTFKTELSRSKFEKDSSPILKLLRKSEGNILIPYWRIPN